MEHHNVLLNKLADLKIKVLIRCFWCIVCEGVCVYVVCCECMWGFVYIYMCICEARGEYRSVQLDFGGRSLAGTWSLLHGIECLTCGF